MRRYAAFALLLGACAGALPGSDPIAIPDQIPRVGNANELLVVDCVLPAKVKKLGTKLTYLAPRRPIKTSATDCEIRGGEYVAYDRADYRTALQVWRPQAEEGDAKAQTYVGEIHEKGLGVAPNYALAAEWYRRAADQGYGPAQINLGQLFELGRGVERDADVALDWYRKASGLSDLGLEFASFRNDAKAQQQLKSRLATRDSELAGLKREIVALQRDLAETSALRTDFDPEAERRILLEESEALRRMRIDLDIEREQLAARPDPRAAQQRAETELDRRATELASREAAVREREVVTVQSNADTGALPDDFDPEAERRILLEESEALRRMRIDLEIEREQLAALPDATVAEQRAEAELDRRAAELASREAAVHERERGIDAKTQQLAGLEEKIQSLERKAESSREKVVLLAQAERLGIPGPTIQLVDPSLIKTRSARPVTVPVSGRQHTVVGRVEAPAGLLTLMVNEIEAEVSAEGYFETRVRVRRGGTTIAIIAIDQQGKRANRSFVLRSDPLGGAPAARQTAPSAAPGVEFGRYYALVIGNQNYQNMPPLDTARADAQAVASILKDRYGFTVIPRYDANRYEILYILNELRRRLTKNDNLLIYYAGHGELDEVNGRGHWLPIDAEPDNSTNWISNVQVTDILNAMKAKHVMVIADSCYSGALTEAAVAQLDQGLPLDERRAWQEAISKKRSRTAFTSGGLAPVMDGGGGGNHSVFAKALLGVLAQNDDVLEGWRLHREVAARVTYAARQQSFEQRPQYAPIKHGGHEAGDFLLVPRG